MELIKIIGISLMALILFSGCSNKNKDDLGVGFNGEEFIINDDLEGLENISMTIEYYDPEEERLKAIEDRLDNLEGNQ